MSDTNETHIPKDYTDLSDEDLRTEAVRLGSEFQTVSAEYEDTFTALDTLAADLFGINNEITTRGWSLEDQRELAYQVADDSGLLTRDEVDQRFAALAEAQAEADAEDTTDEDTGDKPSLVLVK